MSWLTRKLGEVLTLKRGYDLPSSKRQFGSIPIVSSSGITGTHNICKVEGPGVVTGRYGTIGNVYYVNNDFWPLNTALYVQDFKGNDPRFVSYFLSHVLMFTQSDKAAVPGVNRNDLHAKDVLFPPKEIHTKIASILSAYDDLIENNNRRIALLEESARLLYREWFVRLRFPGHEHTRITDGVPDGWERGTAFDAMDVMSGGTPKTKVEQYWNGDIPFYTPKDSAQGAFVSETEKTLTDEGLSSCNSKFYPKDTLFITARGTVGNLNLAMKPMAMNQSCYALKGKRGFKPFFLYCAMKETVQHLKQHAVGAVFDAIVVKTFKMIPFLIPKLPISDAFEDLITPTFNQVKKLMQQNQKLKTARDLLLPKLMNGEIPV